MRNGFYFAASFGSLLIGFVSGWLANSKLEHYNFINYSGRNYWQNAEDISKNNDDRSPKLSGKLELKIRRFDPDNKIFILDGNDNRIYKIEYDDIRLKGSICELNKKL